MKRNGSPSPGAVRVIPADRLAAAAAMATSWSQRDGMIFETLIETAVRNQECRLLIVEDLWREGQVPHALIVRSEIAKNSRRRTIPLTKSFRQKMRSWIIGPRFHGREIDPGAALFPSIRTQGHLTRRGLCRIVAQHTRTAGFPATPHMIRHTAATELIRVCNARVVQLVLGHQRLDTVQIYTHPSDDDIRQALERRSKARTPLPPSREENLRNATKEPRRPGRCAQMPPS